MESERKPVDDSATSGSFNYCIDLSRQFQLAIERKQEVRQQQQQSHQLKTQQDSPTALSRRITKVVMQPCELKLPIRLETWLSDDGTLIVRPKIEPQLMAEQSSATSSGKHAHPACVSCKPTMTTTTNSNTADGDVGIDEDDELTPVCNCSAAVACQSGCCQHRHSEEVLYDQVGACLPASSTKSREGRKQKKSIASSGKDWSLQQSRQTTALGEDKRRHQLVQQQQQQHRQHHNHHCQQQQQQHQPSRNWTLRSVEPRQNIVVSPGGEDDYKDDNDQSSVDTPTVGDSQLSSSTARKW